MGRPISKGPPLRHFTISPEIHLSVPFCIFPIYALLTWSETVGTEPARPAELGCDEIASVRLIAADSATYAEQEVFIHDLLFIKKRLQPNQTGEFRMEKKRILVLDS